MVASRMTSLNVILRCSPQRTRWCMSIQDIHTTHKRITPACGSLEGRKEGGNTEKLSVDSRKRNDVHIPGQVRMLCSLLYTCTTYTKHRKAGHQASGYLQSDDGQRIRRAVNLLLVQRVEALLEGWVVGLCADQHCRGCSLPHPCDVPTKQPNHLPAPRWST